MAEPSDEERVIFELRGLLHSVHSLSSTVSQLVTLTGSEGDLAKSQQSAVQSMGTWKKMFAAVRPRADDVDPMVADAGADGAGGAAGGAGGAGAQ